jgi:hypothetical protein
MYTNGTSFSKVAVVVVVLQEEEEKQENDHISLCIMNTVNWYT